MVFARTAYKVLFVSLFFFVISFSGAFVHANLSASFAHTSDEIYGFTGQSVESLSTPVLDLLAYP